MWWLYAFCFLLCLFGVSALDAARKRGSAVLELAIAYAMICAAFVVFGKGVVMALDWSDPLAGRHVEVVQASHGSRGMVVVALLTVWPFFLMVVATGAAYLASLALRRRA